MTTLSTNMRTCLDRLDIADVIANQATTHWVTRGTRLTCRTARHALDTLSDLGLVEKEKINASNVMWRLTATGKHVVYALHQNWNTGSWLT